MKAKDSVIAWILDGRTARDKGLPEPVYHVPLPEPGEAKRAILDSYTKEHSAEYQSQALIDLAFRMRERIADLAQIEKIILHTSHHTHYVIGMPIAGRRPQGRPATKPAKSASSGNSVSFSRFSRPRLTPRWAA